MAGQKTISVTYTPPIIPPSILKLVVTGNPNPDCKGDYFPDGLIDGRMSYLHTGGVYLIRFHAISGKYWLWNQISGANSRIWIQADGLLEGDYGYIAPATGTAHVEAVY